MITFSDKPNEDFLLNAFNNNVFVFESDSVETPLYCEIEIDVELFVVSIETTPINGVFYFNTKEVLSIASFKNKFADNERPIIGFQSDGDLRGTIDLDFTITFANNSNDSASLPYEWIRGVEQINELIPKNINSGNPDYLLCLPNLTAFAGYPFDFAIVFDAPTIINEKNGQEVSSTLSNSVLRLFTSDGQTEVSDFITRVLSTVATGFIVKNSCLAGYGIPSFLEVGINTLTFPNTLQKIIIDKKDICDGVYLKWINEFGTWSYWLFSSIYNTQMQASTQSIYNTDYIDITKTRTVELSTGKKAQDLITLNAQTLNENEMQQVKSIFVSPKVELYNGVYGDSNDILDFKKFWQTVQVLDGSVLIKETKRNLINVGFQIRKNRYTQS